MKGGESALRQVLHQTKDNNISILAVGVLACVAFFAYMGFDSSILAPASSDVLSNSLY